MQIASTIRASSITTPAKTQRPGIWRCCSTCLRRRLSSPSQRPRCTTSRLCWGRITPARRLQLQQKLDGAGSRCVISQPAPALYEEIPIMLDKSDLQRYLRLEGCANMRDIGGYETLDGRRTRWKVILRSDNLDKLPPASQQAVVDYGVTTVIDLSEREEIERQPDVFATSEVVKYLHLPLKGSPEIVSGALEFETREDLYLYYLENCTQQIKAVLDAIAGVKRGGTLIHCVAGKDRTGIVAALLLALAKVPPEMIAYDYGITSLYLAEKVQRWREKLIETHADVTRFDREVACPPESMQIVLAEIGRRHGGVESYMQRIGLSQASIDRLLGRDSYQLPDYFGKMRFTYFRNRTASHNTVLIDNTDQDPVAEAPIVAHRFQPDNSYVRIDLSRAYPGRVRRFERGVALHESRHVIVQDEIEAPAPVEALWGMVTDAEADLRGAAATLRKGAWMLDARVLAPAGAKFDVVSGSAPPPQNPNEGSRKLVVQIGRASCRER